MLLNIFTNNDRQPVHVKSLHFLSSEYVIQQFSSLPPPYWPLFGSPWRQALKVRLWQACNLQVDSKTQLPSERRSVMPSQALDGRALYWNNRLSLLFTAVFSSSESISTNLAWSSSSQILLASDHVFPNSKNLQANLFIHKKRNCIGMIWVKVEIDCEVSHKQNEERRGRGCLLNPLHFVCLKHHFNRPLNYLKSTKDFQKVTKSKGDRGGGVIWKINQQNVL